MRRRHPGNTNLTYHHSGPWNGYEVQLQRGPLFIPYLERIHQTMQRAIHSQASTMAVRVDLMLPANGYVRGGSWVPSFIKSLQSQVNIDMERRRRKSRWAPTVKIEYVVVRERVVGKQAHYHVCLFLHGESYRGLGAMPAGRGSGGASFDPDVPGDPRAEQADSLAKKIVTAWARALGWTMGEAVGLVHFPVGGVYRLRRSGVGFEATEAGLFNRLSYLAKAESKEFGQGCRNILYSRGG
ncbi:inovirus-type Gp2 protein [Alcanivorax sp. IL2]|uniref:YagK/YfjJ domain-containing protein n=1 Tax=Alcanivorax sp. IL2 TaxID=3396310 RepID=UPI0039C0829C